MFGCDGNLDNTIFQLKLTSKQLDRYAKRAFKDSNSERDRVKKAIVAKNMEGARIHAENAIRKKHEYLNFLRLSARVDGVCSKVQTASAVKGVVRDLAGVTRSLEKAMSSMELEKVSKIMEKFEAQFENLDVKAGVLEGAMSTATTLSTPEEEVASLIKQVAEENGLELALHVDKAPLIDTSLMENRSTAEEKALSARLAALRN